MDPLVLSFLCSFLCLPFSFGFVVSLGDFIPVGSADVVGHRYWAGVVEDVCCFVLSFVTVGHWVIGRPLNGSCWSLLELVLWCFLGFLVLVLPTVHSAQ